jgi:hypothetical protein
MSARLLPLGGKGVCSDFIMADSREQEGYGGSSMGLIGTGLAQGGTGMCWASGGRATGAIGTGLAQGRTGMCWTSGGRATGTIGTGLAQGRTGMCWASGGRATGTTGTGLTQGRTGICWASGGRATGAWLTEGLVLAGFRLPRLVDCLLFLNLREWSIIQE